MGQLAIAGGKALVKRFDKMLGESERVVQVADTAYKLRRSKDCGLERPRGMSEADFNIASDAMQPQKDCPTYLRMHYSRLELAQRIAGGAGNGDGAPLIQFIQNNFQSPKYDVIDVTPVKKE